MSHIISRQWKSGINTGKSFTIYLASIVYPYAELARLHKPVGIMNIYFPYLFGYVFTCCTSNDVVQPLQLWKNLGELFVFAFVLRSAGCSWNDIVDRDIDRLVERTRLRPVARGAISVPAGRAFTATQVAILLVLFSKLLPQDWLLFASPLVFLVWLYPLTKRFTDFAQFVLGVTLGWGVLVGAAIDGLSILDESQSRRFGLAGLYLVYIIWTTIHDVIYAHQDVKDDVKIGVRSMAVRWLQWSKTGLSMLTILQILILWATGVHMGAGIWYSFGAVGGNTSVLAWMLLDLDLDSPKNCLGWFQMGSLLVGLTISVGLLGEYLGKVNS